jgi:cell wall assembly regulator SMI1
MISRQSVLDYLNKHPNHSNWQMRLHFLQASHQPDSESSISIGSIANQLNYILRDLEAIGKIPPQIAASVVAPDSHRNEATPSIYSNLRANPPQVRVD